MKINRNLVIKVRKMEKLTWNDRAWHDFMKLPEVESIQYGLEATKGMPLRDYTDIIVEAKIYYELNFKGKVLV